VEHYIRVVKGKIAAKNFHEVAVAFVGDKTAYKEDVEPAVKKRAGKLGIERDAFKVLKLVKRGKHGDIPGSKSNKLLSIVTGICKKPNAWEGNYFLCLLATKVANVGIVRIIGGEKFWRGDVVILHKDAAAGFLEET
jgi:hypothetical protein